jgi:hypothetical protein
MYLLAEVLRLKEAGYGTENAIFNEQGPEKTLLEFRVERAGTRVVGEEL